MRHNILILVFLCVLIIGCINPGQKLTKNDVNFSINCLELNGSEQIRCNTYLEETELKVYPILKDFAGHGLSHCYETVEYMIKKDEPDAAFAGGGTVGNKIFFYESYWLYSLGSQPYDGHELLHSFSQCNGALDSHIFHNAIFTLISKKLSNPAFTIYRSSQEVETGLEDIRSGRITFSNESKVTACQMSLSLFITDAYLKNGEESLKRLYRTTYREDLRNDETAQIKVMIQMLETELGAERISPTLRGVCPQFYSD